MYTIIATYGKYMTLTLSMNYTESDYAKGASIINATQHTANKLMSLYDTMLTQSNSTNITQSSSNIMVKQNIRFREISQDLRRLNKNYEIFNSTLANKAVEKEIIKNCIECIKLSTIYKSEDEFLKVTYQNNK